VKRFKLLTAVLIFIAAFLFTVKFTFYPISSYFLTSLGVSYSFSTIDINFDGKIKIEKLELSISKLLHFKTDMLEISFSRRSRGFLKKDIAVRKFKMTNSVLTFDSEWLRKTTDITVPDELPFFPLEELNIDNLKIVAVIDEKNGVIADKVSLKGNETYKLKAENTKLFAENISEKLDIKLNATIEAYKYVYILNSLDFETKGIKLSGKKSDSMGNFKGNLSVSFEKVASIFNEKAKGQLESDFVLNISEKTPYIDAVVSTLGVEYKKFQPWDMHAFLNITPTIVQIDRLNLFHQDKVFLSLDGGFSYKKKRSQVVQDFSDLTLTTV